MCIYFEEPMIDKDMTLWNWRTYSSKVKNQIQPNLHKYEKLSGGDKWDNTQADIFQSKNSSEMQHGSTLDSH